eukprot:953471_1
MSTLVKPFVVTAVTGAAVTAMRYLSKNVGNTIMHLDTTATKEFIEMLKWKDAQGSVLWLDDYKCSLRRKTNRRYDETAMYQQYSSVKVSRDVCNAISNQINENVVHLYSHIIKSTTLNENNEFIIQNDKTIR